MCARSTLVDRRLCARHTHLLQRRLANNEKKTHGSLFVQAINNVAQGHNVSFVRIFNRHHYHRHVTVEGRVG
jgi:hypothetical protein